jgi:putative GTP pyrophosphokinase
MITKKNQSVATFDTVSEWYSANRYLFKQLAGKVHIIISELLDLNNLGIHAIFSRAKQLGSFNEKIKDPKYTDPQNQITDLAGIRIICYVESDIPKIRKMIEDNFEIDDENSGDKSDLLGTDRVGYKSVHYVAKLNKARLQLPEYKGYSKIKFEIQIRTILQYAWAEIEHDRNYKFSGELPEEIQRRFKLVAGSLELADKEFDRIASEIDGINLLVEKGTKAGKLDFEINSTTLKQFLNTKFAVLIPEIVKPDFPDLTSEKNILVELNNYGLNNLSDLNSIIPKDFIKTYKNSSNPPSNFVGLLRSIMICNDPKRYFEKSFKNNWFLRSMWNRGIYREYSVPIDDIIKKYKK